MTTRATWTADELARIGGADELEVIPSRADGRTPRAVPIWVVRVGGDLYVRSWRGASGGWFQQARATHEGRIRAGGLERDVRFVEPDPGVRGAIDQAYRSKYSRHGDGYVGPMVADEAAATTLQLVPR